MSDYSLERGLPASMDAERSILGAILLDNQAYYDASDLLRAEDFSLDSHRRIFARIAEMLEQSRAVDTVTLMEELKTQQQLEAVGGVPYLASLTDGVPPRANIRHYVKIVRDKAMLRGAINLGNNLIARAIEQCQPAVEIISDAEKQLLDLSEGVIESGFLKASEIVERDGLMKRITSGETRAGLRTGFTDLDDLTNGLQRRDLIIIAGRPSMGKTSFAMNIAETASTRDNKSVAVFSMEMDKESLLTRMACSLAKVDSHLQRTGMLSKGDVSRISIALGQLMDAPLYIDDTPGISVMQMRAKLRRLKRQCRGLDLVIVDYLQLMSPSPGRKSGNRTEEVSAMTRGLKLLAGEIDAPLIAISQLSRETEKRTNHKPQLSDLRESGSIEQDADVVGFIFRPEVYEEDEHKKLELAGIADLILAKQRNGPIGTVKLCFIGKCTRFESRAFDYPQQERQYEVMR